MKLSHWLSLSALLSAGLVLWSLREIIIQLFAGIVLAMAICTLVDKLRSKIHIARQIALVISMLIIMTIHQLLNY